MKLRTATKIQKLVFFALWLIMLPFGLCGMLLDMLTKAFEWIINWFDGIRFHVGNRLLRMSDEAKDVTIQNDYCLRNFTAVDAYKKLKEEIKDYE